MSGTQSFKRAATFRVVILWSVASKRASDLETQVKLKT